MALLDTNLLKTYGVAVGPGKSIRVGSDKGLAVEEVATSLVGHMMYFRMSESMAGSWL